jgi:Zn-dependent M28 family amino/carboxypeptidase
VIGVLRGSDPDLRNTYVVVSAHYDHLGVRTGGSGDRIFNGANDDASGTASVIEMANAFAGLAERPKRSIVFMAFFGEERGLVGSQYYVAHPLVPLAQTVTDINIEQTGRIDDDQGKHPLQFNATGNDYTNLASVFQQAGEAAGVRLVKDAERTNQFFSQSDNLSFSSAGIPSTTVSVTYEFPDAHQPGDEWQKLDYPNMARVDGAIAVGVWTIAQDPQAPQWNLENAAAAAYARNRKTN